MGFGQEDYTQFEDRGSVEIEVTKLEANNERIVVDIVPLTFDEFAITPGLVLPPELVPIVDGVDPAECKIYSGFLMVFELIVIIEDKHLSGAQF